MRPFDALVWYPSEAAEIVTPPASTASPFHRRIEDGISGL
jgi:hypothetical protein